MRTSRSTLLGMKPSSSKEYISFGVPDFESPHKSGNLLRNFIAKLTGANSNNQQNSKCKFQLPEVQESANIETECHEVSDLSHPIPNVNISQETSVFSSGQLSEPIRQSERRYWMQDENCKFCFECGSRFTAIRRKHHCRVCGRIFCNQCSNQFVEGTQIGLDGLQRACSYCAEVLITTDTKKPEYSLSKHAMQSLNADNAYALKKKVSEIGHNGKNNMSDSIPSQISHLSSRNVHVNTSLNTISNGKGVLNSTLRFRRQTLDSFNPCHSTSNNSTDESPDLFPTYVPTTFANASFSAVISSPPNSTEKVKHHSMGTSAFHLIHRTPCKNKTLIVDDSINTNVPSTPFKKISLSHSFECLLSCTSPSLFNSSSDQEMLLLWSRIWANSSEDSSFPITITSKLNAVSTESSSLIHSHSNENVTKENSSSKLLQLFKWKRDNEEVYCVYGLVLVYWLVNNIPGLKHCRMKGRIVCQKFMDLGLLTDLQDPNSREFHDDFTFYRLKQINSDSRSNHQTSSRRKTMDSISCDNDWFRVNSNTYPSTFGIDEPDWLLEINGRENKNSGSSTPFLLESFNDDTSKPSTVSYNDNILSNFEVGQDVSRMREYSSEGHKSPKKRQYVSQPIATTNQESSVSIQPDSTVQLSKHKNIYNMKAAFDEHIYQLVLQDIRDNALHPSWVSILIRLAWKVCQTVGFDLRSTGMRYFQFNRQQQQLPTSGVVNSSVAHNNAANPNASHRQKVYSSMDIRYYVHIKKLLDKDNNSSDVFPGTIFSKHPTHKLMPSVLNNPRILLLDSSISYQRTTSKMAWLESQIMQEEEYITNCVCKILCLHPNIIFISGTVCHLAQNFIFKSGIILFSNVKQSVLYRIARMTGADILDSVDRLLSNPTRKSDNNCQKPTTRLGVCNRFEVRQIHLSDNSTKFLTFIENNLSESGIAPNASGNNNTSANPIRFITHEATVILRGDDIASIIRAKRCFLFALRLCYNAQLELAYSNNDHILHLPDLSIIQGTNSRTRVHSFHKMCMENNVSNNNTLVSSPVVRKKALTLPGSVLSTSATMHEQIIAPNDEANESAYSDLAIYLRGRILSISPCIEFRLPYLASKEGQLSYLYAYYTYVIDWPLGRKLNDLMKRKIKVIHSEMKALEYYRINVKSDNSFSEQIVNGKSHHPFTKRNLEISSSSNVYDAKSNCYVPYSHDDSINNNYALDGLVITETLTSSDEALYTDYKARAFMISVGKKNGETCRSFPRLWGSIGSILSGHWDLLFNTEKLKSFKSKFAGFHSTTTGFTHNSNIQVHSENESIKRLRRSILDPRSYQSLSFLAVLFTPKCILRPEPCVPPLIATIEFYGQNDLPLGLFLEKFCFMQQHCRNPLCNVPMSEHIQRFIQTSGSVQLTISKSIHDISQSEVLGDSPMICGNGDFKSRPKSRIQMWLFCPICRTNSAIRYMSADTWHLSFVKFLDLILNSSNDWARCDMLSKNSSNWRSTSGNEYDVVEKQKESSHSVGTDIANNHIIDPILEFNCPHSVHKSLEHCFSFDQKLATFKYQSINVYEIVMPPSEIRIFPIKTNPMKSDSNHISTTKKPPTGGKLNKNDNEFSDHCGGEDKPGQFHNQSNSSSLASRVTNIRKTPHLPSYLLTEATEVLTKYYTIHTVIKCHIANLQNETISCELSAMLEAYLKVLEADSSRILMDERSEFLNFLLYPNDDCQVDEKSVKKQNEYTANTPESVLHSVDSINQSPVIRPKSNLLVNEGNNEHISKLTEETFDSPLNQNDSLVTSDIDHMITCRQVTQRNVRNHTNSVSSSLNHSGEITTIHDVAENETRFQDWSKMTCGLNHVEIAYIVQRLVNELKRWIYRFVSDWNFRFNEYELLMKRIEKNIRDTRKKATVSNTTATVTTTSCQPSIIAPGHSAPTQIPAASIVTETATAVIEPTLINISNRMNNLLDPTKSNELIYKGLSQHNGNLNQISSSSSIIIEDPSYQTIDSTVTSQNETESLIHCNSGNKSLTSLQISLNNSLTDCLPEMYQPIKNDGRKYKYIKNTSRLNSFKSGLHSLDDKGHNSSQLPESTIGSPDNTLFDSFKHLSILDPVNLKAVYQRHDPEFTNSSMIYQNQPNKSDSLDNLIQNLMPTQNNPSSSGVRRFIHTFLSSAMDLKVFGEPVPTYEHPQLTVCNESCVKILKRFHTSQSKLSELTSNFNDFTRPPGSICQLLLANPDIYVNDREFTSIIAFALTTPEYERKLVDLHSTLQGPIQLSSDVQLGQSALANFRDDEPLIANINVTDTGSVGKNEKSTVILNNEVSVAIPTDYDSPTKSDIHQEVNSRISSSSNLNTSRDQKQPGLVSASPGLPTGSHLPPVGSDKSNVSRSRHIKIQFSDSSTNFFCCIYYAAEFFRLRQLVMPNGDMSFIQSLSRCYHWDARGGKSGSLFMKTRDERFVIKELSSIEMKTFHEISHEYFDYLITSALDQRLCVLSRILGIFHVGFKNSASGEAHRFDVLVMENLFHGRTQLAYIYDLKGSLRKRLADESSKSIKISTNGITPNVDTAHEIDENMSYTDSSPSGCITSIGDNELSSEIFNQRIPVLLDQNLLNASIDNPLYLRVHSKNALSHCLNMDTTFLANLFIMDYSLLVGVDTSTNQLVVGLIDYLRKFTLDKRLEMIIKQTITSAQGPMPTILTPDLYRERFLYQLHSYFPLVPDQWYDSLAEHTEGWHVRIQRKPVSKKQ